MLLALNQPHSVTLEALAHSHGLPGTDIEGVAAKTSREDIEVSVHEVPSHSTR